MDLRHRTIVSCAAAGLVVLTFAFARPSVASAQCGELIVNGDFEAGNTGFTTGYNLAVSPSLLYPERTFAVTSNPNAYHSCFGGTGHGGSGNQMAVNAAVAANVVVWSETVPVLANTNYALSAWVTSHCGAISQAVLSFRVNGVQVGGSFWAPATQFAWNQYAGTWASGAATSATIEIIDLNQAAGGNDFGLDDISFMKIDETAPVITTASFSMWPPDHLYRTFTLGQLAPTITDDCDAAPAAFITAVWSDEPEDANGTGDGETLNDIVIAGDCQSVQLRSERQGAGNGRVYTVEIRAVDSKGNWSTATATVSVPHSANGTAVDDGAGAGYTFAGPCAVSKSGAQRASEAGLTLAQNYPNPFNPSTTLTYSIPADAHVFLRVYDLAGSEVVALVNGFESAGTHRVTFNASSLPSGMYVYRLESDGVSLQRMMQLVK